MSGAAWGNLNSNGIKCTNYELGLISVTPRDSAMPASDFAAQMPLCNLSTAPRWSETNWEDCRAKLVQKQQMQQQMQAASAASRQEASVANSTNVVQLPENAIQMTQQMVNSSSVIDSELQAAIEASLQDAAAGRTPAVARPPKRKRSAQQSRLDSAQQNEPQSIPMLAATVCELLRSGEVPQRSIVNYDLCVKWLTLHGLYLQKSGPRTLSGSSLPNTPMQLVFHGTDADNFKSIVEGNLKVPPTVGLQLH